MDEKKNKEEKDAPQQPAAETPEPAAQDPVARVGKRWFLTALLVFALIALGLVLYAAKSKPTEFFYVLF